MRKLSVLFLVLASLFSEAGQSQAQTTSGCIRPQTCYWFVTDSSPGTQVFFGGTGTFVVLADAGYVAWAAVNTTPTVPTIAGLLQGVSTRPAWATHIQAVAASNVNLSTALAAGQVLDTYTLVLGDLVAVTNQSTPSQNGLYRVTASAAVRATDVLGSWYDVAASTAFYVENGSAWRGSLINFGTSASVNIWGAFDLVGSTTGTGPIVAPQAQNSVTIGGGVIGGVTYTASAGFGIRDNTGTAGTATQVLHGSTSAVWGSVANADLSTMGNGTIKCRSTGGTGAPEDCTTAQVGALFPTTGPSVFVTGANATYTTPAGTTRLQIEGVGGGGGGAGSGTTPAAAGDGGDTCVAASGTACSSSLLKATGGTKGLTNGATCTAGSGTTGSLTEDDTQDGGLGLYAVGTASQYGGIGGSSRYGGAGPGGALGATGLAAAANSGSGGGGAGNTVTANTGGGGCGGGWFTHTIVGPAGSYSYTVGAAGTAGGAGTGGFTGAVGGSGKLKFTPYFNFLLRRDLGHANDNSPMWVSEAA